jgi:hypothetical protein
MAIRALRHHGGAIEDEIFALLVQNRQAVETERIAQQVDRRIRLLDDAEERSGVRNGDRAYFGAAAEVLEQKFQLLGELFRGVEFFRDFARSIARQNKSFVTFSLEQDSLENVLSEIDSKYRVSAPRHGGIPV